MGTISTIILFIAPGILIKEIRDYIAKEKQIDQTIYQFLTEIVVDSVMVMLPTILFLNYKGWQLYKLSEISQNLDAIKNLYLFILVMVFMTLAWYVLKYWIICKVILLAKNKYLKKYQAIIHEEFHNPLDAIMKTKPLINTWMIVSLYNNSEYISSGMINRISSSNSGSSEIVLIHSHEIEFMKKECPELFREIWYEYIDSNTGLRIVFYNQKATMERWQELFNI